MHGCHAMRHLGGACLVLSCPFCSLLSSLSLRFNSLLALAEFLDCWIAAEHVVYGDELQIADSVICLLDASQLAVTVIEYCSYCNNLFFTALDIALYSQILLCHSEMLNASD